MALPNETREKIQQGRAFTMKYLDLSMPQPEENLALDEALVDYVEAEECDGVLRFWESPGHFVVVGYSNRIPEEVRVEACQEKGIPILRRCTGGGTVIQGPGCLNYSLILPIQARSELQTVTGANCFVMDRHRDVLASLLGKNVEVLGHTDLTVDLLKFSGNAQRRKRACLLLHGTFLLTFELGLVECLLRFPSKQPAYRQNRSHGQFVTNVDISAETLKGALKKAWSASDLFKSVPTERTNKLLLEKYANPTWIWQR